MSSLGLGLHSGCGLWEVFSLETVLMLVSCTPRPLIISSTFMSSSCHSDCSSAVGSSTPWNIWFCLPDVFFSLVNAKLVKLLPDGLLEICILLEICVLLYRSHP